MGRDGKGFGGRLFDAGTKLVSRAAERVLNDPRGQDAVARAVGLAQRSKKRVELVQGQLMRVAGIPGRQEYDEMAKQLARLKRKARELAEQLEAREDNHEQGAGDVGGETSEPAGKNGGSRH
jgi:hypothetical protein